MAEAADNVTHNLRVQLEGVVHAIDNAHLGQTEEDLDELDTMFRALRTALICVNNAIYNAFEAVIRAKEDEIHPGEDYECARCQRVVDGDDIKICAEMYCRVCDECALPCAACGEFCICTYCGDCQWRCGQCEHPYHIPAEELGESD